FCSGPALIVRSAAGRIASETDLPSAAAGGAARAAAPTKVTTASALTLASAFNRMMVSLYAVVCWNRKSSRGVALAIALVGCSADAPQNNSQPIDASSGETSLLPVDASSPDTTPTTPDGGAPSDTSPDQTAPLADAPGPLADADTGPTSDSAMDATPDAGDCTMGDSGEATELRCTGLYSDWNSRTLSPDVRPYAPAFALWSDGAAKARWIYLPSGQRIDTSNMDEWKFPIGTKVWKEFSVAGKRIETRLLWKTADSSWFATTYRWSADEATTRELTDGELNADGNQYEVPSQKACVECHQGRHDYVLGFEAVSLSSPAATGATMDALTAQHLISAPPTTPIVVPGNAMEAAALGYLHANCGTTCHNVNIMAPGTNTGFHSRLDVATLTSVQATDTWTSAWNMAARFPILPSAMRLAQCSTTQSDVFYRMTHRDSSNDAASTGQMPKIDTHKVDSLGVGIIAAWITAGCADAGPDARADASSDARSQ
ncbi:MAG: hypothetical protein M3O46_00050, partial [Myxococcota bacterium]|nr:hypothetical protein [Myxococcota bacterium]